MKFMSGSIWERKMTDEEIKRSQELFGKTERLEAENKRLQELLEKNNA